MELSLVATVWAPLVPVPTLTVLLLQLSSTGARQDTALWTGFVAYPFALQVSRRVQERLREVPRFVSGYEGTPRPQRLRGGNSSDSEPDDIHALTRANREHEWSPHTALVITDRGNLALTEVHESLQDVLHGAFRNVTETIAFVNAFPDANALNKEAFLRQQVIEAAEELHEDEIGDRCRLDRRWFKFLKAVVSQCLYPR